MTPVVVWVLCSALPMPRTLKSLPWPKLLTTMLGAANCSASTLLTPFFASVSPLITEAEAGVVIRFSLRRSAVTIIALSSVEGASLVLAVSVCAAALAGGPSCAAATPVQTKASVDAPNNRALAFIVPLPCSPCRACPRFRSSCPKFTRVSMLIIVLVNLFSSPACQGERAPQRQPPLGTGVVRPSMAEGGNVR